MIFLLIIVGSLFWFSPFFIVEDKISAKDIIKNVQNKYESLSDLSADFVRRFEWKLAGSTDYVEGKIFIKKDNKFRLEIKDQMIITDGKVSWSYSKINNQVIIDHVDVSDNSFLPSEYLFGYPKKHHSSLIGEEKDGDVHYYKLKLIPKSDDSFEVSKIIWVNSASWIIERVQILDINENVITIHVSNIVLNQNLSDDLFKFDIPKEVEIIDIR